ncbi:MAG: PRC-barrel domain-containing protein [Alphaproteobacteria bacterium]|nr:PRC-barrel domain-containing protein [Alphaproteobacteria bacterium]
MTHRSLRNLLLASTALSVIAYTAPSIAQSQTTNQAEKSQFSQNQFNQNNRFNRDNGFDRVQQRDRSNRSNWTFSDERNFSKIQIAPASDIIGQTLGSDDGRASGDIEYMLIEPVSGKVMYLLVGMGDMFEFNQRLAVVPFEAVNVTESDDETKLTLRASATALRNAPSLPDNALNELTSPRMQYVVRNYWTPASRDAADESTNRGMDRSGNRGRDVSRDMSSDSSRNQSDDRQASRSTSDDSQSWSDRRYTPSGNWQDNTPADRFQSSDNLANSRSDQLASRDRSQAGDDTSDDRGDRQASRSDDKRSGGDQSSRDRSDARNDAQSDEQRQAAQSRTDRSDGDQSSRTAQGTSADDGQTYTLVARTYITALAPPAVMRPEQIRGATVANREGDEIGSIESLMIDMDRGYVAYALISEGGFLGIGENYRPVPIQALSWRQGEQFVLPMSNEQLRSMPNLRDNETPTTVRRSHVERLYDSYQTQPYWQQAADQRGNMRSADNGSSGSDDLSERRDRSDDAQQSRSNRDRNEDSSSRNPN